MHYTVNFFHFKLIAILLCTSLVLSSSCKSSDESNRMQANNQMPPDDDPISTFYKILPLGDSRVEGATINSVSYRYDLWKTMVSNQWNFDFIGTQNDNTSYPLLLGKSFDPDHEGIGGSKTEDILENIDDIIDDLGVPDVVLLGIGGNDLVASISVTTAIDNINQTIDLLQNSNPNIIIFLEQIAPGRSNVMSPEAQVIHNSFNENIRVLAMEQTNEASKIITINMFSNWTDDYMADNLHYNSTGAAEVASRYFEAIEANLE